MENYLTTKEFAERVGLTSKRINQLITDKVIVGEKRAGSMFILESEIAKVTSRPEKRGRPRKTSNDEKESVAAKNEKRD